MRPYYRLMRFASQVFFAVFFRGRVFGLRHVPRRGGVMLACNHQSYFDPLAASLAIPRECHYMARDTLFRNPLFGRLIESLNSFPVRRGAADVGAVKELMRRLKNDQVVVVFPEATRTRDGSIGAINANAMGVARKTGAVIVPTLVDGAFEAWPRDARIPRPRPVHVTYARPITAEQVRQWEPERIAQVVSERLDEAMRRSQSVRRRLNAPC